VHELISALHRDLHSAPIELLNAEEARLRGIEHMSYPRVHYLRNDRNSAVAYWAEAEIFGGPVFFARRHPMIPEVSLRCFLLLAPIKGEPSNLDKSG
jgi:hypothetical protein